MSAFTYVRLPWADQRSHAEFPVIDRQEPAFWVGSGPPQITSDRKLQASEAFRGNLGILHGRGLHLPLPSVRGYAARLCHISDPLPSSKS